MIKSILILVSVFCTTLAINANDYGQFFTKINQIDVCHGPKNKECSLISMKILKNVTVSFDVTVKENILPTKVKIVAFFQGKQMLRLPMNKPCDNFFLKSLLMATFNMTNNCVVLKGHYNFSLDMDEVIRNYYQGSFLYGDWMFRSLLWTEECNFICILNNFTTYPKRDLKQD